MSRRAVASIAFVVAAVARLEPTDLWERYRAWHISAAQEIVTSEHLSYLNKWPRARGLQGARFGPRSIPARCANVLGSRAVAAGALEKLASHTGMVV